MTARSTTLAVALVLMGLSACCFFADEASVTLGLARVDDVTYVTTFQAVNETIRNAAFASVFFGAIPAVAAALLLHRNTARRVEIAAALALAVAGLAIPAVGLLPLNDELAEVERVSVATAAAARAEFEDAWNLRNLVRTGVLVAGFAVLVLAAVRGGQDGRAAADEPDRSGAG